jgi:suppressor of G2 allele of SKP1
VKSASSKKIELKLKKKLENFNWMGVEVGGEAKHMAQAVPQQESNHTPSYPTSSKTKKNWDAIDKDIKKEESADKPEGDSALNALFKQIYERADEDTRRAMVKSYQTSGGTVLSTNWDEVHKKDYEGKDRPDAPDGQQWAKNN